jgi:serine/threonine protein kinase
MPRRPKSGSSSLPPPEPRSSAFALPDDLESGFDPALLRGLQSDPDLTFSGPSVELRPPRRDNAEESDVPRLALDGPGLTLSRWSIGGSSFALDRPAASGSGNDDETGSEPGPGFPPNTDSFERASPGDAPARPGRSKPAPAPYDMLRRVGRGGFGEVWMARQNSLSRLVAVKTLRRDVLDSLGGPSSHPGKRAAVEFHQEALAAARLEHPNIVPVHDIGLGPDGAPMLAMKLVQGEPWDKALKRDLLELSPADLLGKHLPTLIAVAQAVAFAHAKGIVHRDLKPAQVMTGEFGEALLMDWGLAIYLGATESPEGRDSDDSAPPSSAFLGGDSIASLPTPGDCPNPAGTPALMAPEQTDATGARIGPWTDVYLLGSTLYFMLTGTYPHAAKSSPEAMAKARALDPQPPQERAPGRDIPADLSDLCLRSMARDPGQRVGSAMEFAEALRDYVSGASKRREATALARQATADIHAIAADLASKKSIPPAEIYERRGAVADTLARALQLWPEFEEAKRLRTRNLAARLETEIAQGDLILADVHVRELTKLAARGEDVDPAPHAAALEAATRRRSAQRRQRKIFAGAAAALMALSLGLAWLANEQSDLAKIATLESAAASKEAQEQARRRQLFQRANALRASEDSLAAEMEGSIPLPESLSSDGGASRGRPLPPPSELAALLGRRDELRRERRSLLGEHVELEVEPHALLLAEANLKLAGGATREDFEEALRLGERAATARPDLHEPLLAMGVAAYRAGHAASATNFLDRAAALAEKRRGPNHADTARAHALSGEAYRLLDNSIEAFRRYEKSVVALEPQWLDLTLALAERNQKLGRYGRALEFASPALALARELRGPDSLEAAEAAYQAGLVLESLHRSDDAAEALEDAIRLFGEKRSPESMEAIRAMKALGSVESQRANHGRAEELLTGALEIAMAAHGEQRPEVATLMHSIGSLNGIKGDDKVAIEWYRKALAVREALFGASHPDVAITVHDLADALGDLARQSNGEGAATADVLAADPQMIEAEALFQRALAFWVGEFGEEHPEVGWTLNSLGMHHAMMGRMEEAEAEIRKGLAIRERTLGPDHPDTGRSAFFLAKFLSDYAHRPSDSIPYWGRVDAIFSRVYRDHPETARAKAGRASALWDAGRREESLEAWAATLETVIRSGTASMRVESIEWSIMTGIHAKEAGREEWFLDLMERLSSLAEANLTDPDRAAFSSYWLARCGEPFVAAASQQGLSQRASKFIEERVGAAWRRPLPASRAERAAYDRLAAGERYAYLLKSRRLFEEAEAIWEEMAAMIEEREWTDRDSLDAHARSVFDNLVGVGMALGRPDAREREQRRLDYARRWDRPNSLLLAEALLMVAHAEAQEGNAEQALALLSEARNSIAASTMNEVSKGERLADIEGLAMRALLARGEVDLALEAGREAARLGVAIFGEESEQALFARLNLAAAAANTGRTDEAREAFQTMADQMERNPSAYPAELRALVHFNLAVTLGSGKRFAEAAANMRKSADANLEAENLPAAVDSLEQAGAFAIETGDYDAMIADRSRAAKLLADAQGASHPDALSQWGTLAELAALGGRPRQAFEASRGAVALYDPAISAAALFQLVDGFDTIAESAAARSDAELAAEAYQATDELLAMAPVDEPSDLARSNHLLNMLVGKGAGGSDPELATDLAEQLRALAATRAGGPSDFHFLALELRALLALGRAAEAEALLAAREKDDPEWRKQLVEVVSWMSDADELRLLVGAPREEE